MIHELKYSNTNTYLIKGDSGMLLFDTGWAGSFPAFCSCMGGLGIPVQDISCILISHYHPDHMGIAQEISDIGPTVAAADVQKEYIHSADAVFAKENNTSFRPIDDEKVIILPTGGSREFLKRLGISGEIIHTPGHSDDSISLCLDSGCMFVGDLNPLYELELHRNDLIGKSWEKLLVRLPKKVFYGHAKTAVLGEDAAAECEDKDLYALVSKITGLIDRGTSPDRIRKKTGAGPEFIEDVSRMYLTHRDIGVQGILDRIESRHSSCR
ncbi:MAG: MBL fold metallo-hydrolase [Lachnospiraceae bacterium]|nr:MBL fold metallo-hydrolase [Lachnospiraceae bacterium]